MIRFLFLLLLLGVLPSKAQFWEAFSESLNQGAAMREAAEESRRRQEELDTQKKELEMKKAVLALEQINSEIKTNETAALYVQRGNVWRYRIFDRDMALNDYLKAVSIESENPSALKELCTLYFETQKQVQAKEICLKAINQNPDCKKCMNYFSILAGKKTLKE